MVSAAKGTEPVVASISTRARAYTSAAAVERLPSDRLRGGVTGGADHGAGRFGPGGLGQGPGQAEVGDGDAALVVEDEVGRLDVAMDQTPPVGVVEGARHVGTHRGGLGRATADGRGRAGPAGCRPPEAP